MELEPGDKKKLIIAAVAVVAFIIMAWLSWPETVDRSGIEYYNGDAVPLPVVMDKSCLVDTDCNFTQCCGCASDCTRDCKENPPEVPCKCVEGVCTKASD